MRQLSPAANRQCGLTLIELMVGLAVLGIVVLAGLSSFRDLVTNSKLQAAAQTLQTTAQWARSEAIKRNITVQLQASDGEFRVVAAPASSAPELIRAIPITAPASVSSFTLNYGSTGTTIPFGQQQTVTVFREHETCGAEIRCPSVVLTAGGIARVCPQGTCP